MSKKIALDFGHGGHDGGASGNGLVEKNVTLEVGNAVAARLKEHGFEVVTLRSNDSYAGNASERGSKLGATKADYALSIHVNAGGGKGAELIVPNKEKYAYVEHHLVQEFSKIGAWRKVYSRDYTSGATTIRTIQSNKMFSNVLGGTDYYGVTRGAWAKGVSADILELFFIDTKTDVDNYLKQKNAYVEAIVKSICLGFGITYKEKQSTFTVKIIWDELNIRKEADFDSAVVGVVKKGEVFTILEEKNGLGKLKSGKGWISMNSTYVQKM